MENVKNGCIVKSIIVIVYNGSVFFLKLPSLFSFLHTIEKVIIEVFTHSYRDIEL
jgi:hypothetical protein